MCGYGVEYAWVVMKIADVKWIKIVTDVFDDEKVLLIESMPDHDAIIVIWFKLLCLAGKNNNKGVFTLNDRIAYTDEMLATILRRPLNTIRLALKTFELYGMVELINGVITIPNWGKHQTLDQIESKREYQREYMASKRNEQKLLANGGSNVSTTVVQQLNDCKANVSSLEVDKKKTKKENKNKDLYNDDFEIFWSAYPRKVKKLEALKAWSKIKINSQLIDDIMIALEKHKKSTDWIKDGGQFIPYPASWLNGERWNDEVEEAQTGLFNGQQPKQSIAEKAKQLEEDYERRHGIKTNITNQGYISIL